MQIEDYQENFIDEGVGTKYPIFSPFQHAEGVGGVVKIRVITMLKYFCRGVAVGTPKYHHK